MPLEACWLVDVIRIEEGEVSAPGRLHAEISRRARAAPTTARVTQYPELPARPLRVPFGNCCSAVGRAIINQQQFPGIQGLRNYAAYRLVDESLRLAKDHDHRHERRRSCCWLAHASRRGCPGAGSVERVLAGEQPAGREEFVRGALLDDPAGLENHRPV
jgi:hypothetical protein